MRAKKLYYFACISFFSISSDVYNSTPSDGDQIEQPCIKRCGAENLVDDIGGMFGRFLDDPQGTKGCKRKFDQIGSGEN